MPVSNAQREEVERARATVERACRELCQARGQQQPTFRWGAVTELPQRLTISMEGLGPIEREFDLSALTAQGGMVAARYARQAIMDALRSR